MGYISESLRRRVADTAGYRCGYCRTSQLISAAQMHVEHIIPLAKGGSDDEENLCLACAWCNSYKGSKVVAIDPDTGEDSLLFNPKRQHWNEHFYWTDDGTEIAGITPIGRATVEALRMNNEHIVASRQLWVLAGWHPPED